MTSGLHAPVRCDAVQEALPAWLAGEREVEVLGLDVPAIEAHLAACAACQAERDAAARVRGWLAEAAAVEPAGAPDCVSRLLAAAGATAQDGAEPAAAVAAAPRPARAGAWRPWLATAAATLVAGIALSVAWPGPGSTAARPAPDGAPQLVAGTLTGPAGEALTALAPDVLAVAGPAGATVARESRWTVAARPATALRLTPAEPVSGPDQELLRIDRGATVWHVVPGRGGLLFATPHAGIRVHGTILSIDVTPDRTTVAVYDGRVQVTSAGQSTTVDAGRAVAVAADRAPILEAAAPAPPDWLPASPTPRLALTGPDGPIRAGAPAWCRVTLTNPGPGLCVLAAPNARDPSFSVAIAAAGASDRSAQALRRLAVRAEPGGPAVVGGLVVLGPGESFAVACDVGSGCTEPGAFDLVARYAAGTDAPAGTFVGTAASAPCRVEVRAP